MMSLINLDITTNTFNNIINALEHTIEVLDNRFENTSDFVSPSDKYKKTLQLLKDADNVPDYNLKNVSALENIASLIHAKIVGCIIHDPVHGYRLILPNEYSQIKIYEMLQQLNNKLAFAAIHPDQIIFYAKEC